MKTLLIQIVFILLIVSSTAVFKMPWRIVRSKSPLHINIATMLVCMVIGTFILWVAAKVALSDLGANTATIESALVAFLACSLGDRLTRWLPENLVG